MSLITLDSLICFSLDDPTGPFGYRLSETSGHNRAELEHRLGHANDRYLRLYTNPPDDIAASYVEDL